MSADRVSDLNLRNIEEVRAAIAPYLGKPKVKPFVKPYFESTETGDSQAEVVLTASQRLQTVARRFFDSELIPQVSEIKSRLSGIDIKVFRRKVAGRLALAGVAIGVVGIGVAANVYNVYGEQDYSRGAESPANVHVEQLTPTETLPTTPTLTPTAELHAAISSAVEKPILALIPQFSSELTGADIRQVLGPKIQIKLDSSKRLERFDTVTWAVGDALREKGVDFGQTDKDDVRLAQIVEGLARDQGKTTRDYNRVRNGEEIQFEVGEKAVEAIQAADVQLAFVETVVQSPVEELQVAAVVADRQGDSSDEGNSILNALADGSETTDGAKAGSQDVAEGNILAKAVGFLGSILGKGVEASELATVTPTATSSPTSTKTPTAAPSATPTSTPIATRTPTPMSTPAPCTPTDLKGVIKSFTSDPGDNPHLSDNPVIFSFENVQADNSCPNNIWIRSFITDEPLNSPTWLEHQKPVTSQITVFNPDGTQTKTSTAEGMISIPDDTSNLKVEVVVPNQGQCYAQVEGVRTDVIDPKAYNGDKMIDYGFVAGSDRDPVTCLPKATPTPTPPPTATPIPCIPTDLKGKLEYSGNHFAVSPVIGHLQNVATNPACSDDIWFDIYGSKQLVVEGEGWLESQEFISQEPVTIPEGAQDFRKSFEIPNLDYCWYQAEAVRTNEKRVPPRYFGDDMIDYVFVRDTDSCLPTETPTPTPTATRTPIPTPTPTSTPKPQEEEESGPAPTATPTRTPTPTPTPAPVVTPAPRVEASPTSVPEAPKLPAVLIVPPKAELPPPALGGRLGSELQFSGQREEYRPLESKIRTTSIAFVRGDEQEVILKSKVDEASFRPANHIVAGKKYHLETYDLPLDGNFGQLNYDGENFDDYAVHLDILGRGPVKAADDLKKVEVGDKVIINRADGEKVEKAVTAVYGSIDPREVTNGHDSIFYTCVTRGQELGDNERYVVVASPAAGDTFNEQAQVEQIINDLKTIDQPKETMAAAVNADRLTAGRAGSRFGEFAARSFDAGLWPIAAAWAMAEERKRRMNLMKLANKKWGKLEADEDSEDQILKAVGSEVK